MKISIIKFICALSRKATGLNTAQSGQALPIVLAMIALGAMVTGPFLSLASSSVIGSKVYGQSYNEIYAAGAGVEQAIWQLNYGNLADTIPDVGNSTSYTLSDSINNLQPDVTVTRVAGDGEGDSQEGMITKPYINKLKFDTTGYTPDMLNVSGSIYAVSCRSSSEDLLIKTLHILPDGSISLVDSLRVSGTGYEPDLVRISETVIAIVYRGSSNDGYVATVGIDLNGNMGSAPIDVDEFENDRCYEPQIINVNGDYYAVVYRGPDDEGYVHTLRITSSGIVSETEVSSYNFSGSDECNEPDIVSISGVYYAIVFRGDHDRGYLSTISINSTGVITNNIISTALFNDDAFTPRIKLLKTGLFGIVYEGHSNDGHITTSFISNEGIITNPNFDTWTFESGASHEPYIIPVTGNVYVIVYRGSNSDGWMKTITINADGSLETTAIDRYEFDDKNGYSPVIIHISGNIFAVAYRGGSNTDGYVITVEISNSSSSHSFHIVSVAGETTISSDVLIDSGAVKVLNWQITK